jgi:Glycosyl hydrolases family 43
MTNHSSGNPILPGRGMCDPHIRIYNDIAYLYATHDKEASNEKFIMEDWWIWSSQDLVMWTHECTIRPEQTYYGKADQSCWAVDAISYHGKYFLYFSRGPQEIGVLQSDTPIGPWGDPLGKPLVKTERKLKWFKKHSVHTEVRDPGLFIDDDGQAYIIYGTWNFYIAKLNEDMISFAEKPKLISIKDPEGPYGKGKTDDKPYLHKRNGIYYLSWGCYYAMAENIYGSYQCHGSILFEENVDPNLLYKHQHITQDRHGSFFEWRNQWYFICNEMGQTQNSHFRDSSIAYVNYSENGEIEPIRIELRGVSLP